MGCVFLNLNRTSKINGVSGGTKKGRLMRICPSSVLEASRKVRRVAKKVERGILPEDSAEGSGSRGFMDAVSLIALGEESFKSCVATEESETKPPERILSLADSIKVRADSLAL